VTLLDAFKAGYSASSEWHWKRDFSSYSGAVPQIPENPFPTITPEGHAWKDGWDCAATILQKNHYSNL
jgi:hypothetical protein